MLQNFFCFAMCVRACACVCAYMYICYIFVTLLHIIYIYIIISNLQASQFRNNFVTIFICHNFGGLYPFVCKNDFFLQIHKTRVFFAIFRIPVKTFFILFM